MRCDPGLKVELGGGVEDVAQPRHRETRLMEILPHLCEAQHRRTYSAGEDIKCHQFADCERTINYKLGSEIENSGGDQFADELHSLACGVAESDDAEARGDIASELLLPTSLHLRLDSHGLKRLNTCHGLDQERPGFLRRARISRQGARERTASRRPKCRYRRGMLQPLFAVSNGE